MRVREEGLRFVRRQRMARRSARWPGPPTGTHRGAATTLRAWIGADRVIGPMMAVVGSGGVAVRQAGR